MKKENKTEEQKAKGERARKVHAKFFAKTEEAIERGYYLEAMCMEYSAIEARTLVIMRELGIICKTPKTEKDQPSVGLKRKLTCLKFFLRDPVFKDTYFDSPDEVQEILDWMDDRNDRIHALYNDTEKYEDMVKANKKLAIEGLKHARTMYDEANRLKNMTKRHPEKIQAFDKRRCGLRSASCRELEIYLATKK